MDHRRSSLPEDCSAAEQIHSLSMRSPPPGHWPRKTPEDSDDEVDEYEQVPEEETEEEPMVKPVFIPKSQRDTIAERERLEAEDLLLEELKKKRLEERRAETKKMVLDKIRENQESWIRTPRDEVEGHSELI